MQKKLFLLFLSFLVFFAQYIKKKVIRVSLAFEKNKNVLVRFFIMKRGRYNRPFLHIATMGVLGIGALIAPFLADTYPVFSGRPSVLATIGSPKQGQSITVDDNVFQTAVSQKPRDTIIIYTVEKGDAVSTIAKKFSTPNNIISEDTIRWANDLKNDDITVGDQLKILPVTGIAHKVSKGDSVYTIAKKYDTNPQAIVDFPFNEFANPETFSLVEGQILMIPDGVKPEEKGTVVRRQYIVEGPVSISDAGFTWPVRGLVSQFSSWYHTALDITSPVGTAIVAGQNGTVVKTSIGAWEGGYGTHIVVEGNGFQTLYSHLSGINVSLGDSVSAGKTVIGWIGMTGRTTGPHVHFEIRRGGALVNPLSYLQ